MKIKLYTVSCLLAIFFMLSSFFAEGQTRNAKVIVTIRNSPLQLMRIFLVRDGHYMLADSMIFGIKTQETKETIIPVPGEEQKIVLKFSKKSPLSMTPILMQGETLIIRSDLSRSQESTSIQGSARTLELEEYMLAVKHLTIDYLKKHQAYMAAKEHNDSRAAQCKASADSLYNLRKKVVKEKAFITNSVSIASFSVTGAWVFGFGYTDEERQLLISKFGYNARFVRLINSLKANSKGSMK